MELPKDFEIQDPWGPVTPAKPVPRRRSPVSGSNCLGSWDVSSGMNGESGDSWCQSNWSQSSAAPALPHASQPTPACSRDGEMRTPSFTHPTHMSYRTLLALSDPAITSNMTNVAPSMLAQITGRGSGSQMMPPASPRQDQLAQIAGCGSSSQMMPPSQTAHIAGCGSSSQMMPPLPRLDQIAGWGSSSLMMPPASPRQDQLPQIALCDSSSQMMPPASSRQNHCLSGPASSLSSSVHGPNSQHGLPFPRPPNLNYAPETSMTNTVASESVVVSPATPANSGKNTKMQDLRCYEIIDLVDDTTSQNVQQNEFRTSQQTALEEALPSFSNPGVSPNIMSLQQQESEINVLPSAETPLQQAERENQGMDLNKTPEQKPRRKKHRPKVIREGKPAKTPKPVTPKPVTPRRAQKTENPSKGKRKYVWKKKDPNSVDSLNFESVNPQNGSASKPVRRSLNFDNEECQARDDRSGSEMMFTPDTETQVAIASSNTKSDVQSVQGWGMGVSENPTGSGMSCDLNSSANQQFDNGYLSTTEGVKRATHIQDEYISMKKCMTSPPQHARKEGENLQKLAWKNNYLNVACNHVIASEDGQNQVASDKFYDALLKGTKRGHSLVDDAQVLGDISHMQANNGTERASVIQKQSTENGQNEGTSNSYSTFTCTPSDPKTIQAAQNTSEAVTFSDAQRFMAYKKMRSSDHMLGFNQAEITSNNRPSQASSAPSHKAVVDCQRASTPVKPSGHVNAGFYQPSSPEKPSEFTNNHDSMSIGPQARIEALIASNQLKLKAKGLKKKEQLQVNPMFSNAKLGTLIPYRDPVDEIIQKLSRLNINGGKMIAKDQEQNALVPYVGGVGTMVIFQGKKRRPRPKVDLDPESDRVWRVLMGKEADEEMGADKEKWWEEERRVFRGRAESFIARMHLVQGDRCFSKWKGSVVDSVIGVFLTRNVSDHLSSSAFMSLAARFPVGSSGTRSPSKILISREAMSNSNTRERDEDPICDIQRSNNDFAGGMKSQNGIGFPFSQLFSKKDATVNINDHLCSQSFYTSNASHFNPQASIPPSPSSLLNYANQFYMDYGIPTNFIPHIGHQFSVQASMNASHFAGENQTFTSSKKRGKKQSNTPDDQTQELGASHGPRRNWTKEEDVALTKAYLHISIDPIIGKDQSSDTMWSCVKVVWKDFLGENFVEDRPQKGLSKRWCTIQGAVNKFHSIYEALARSPRSGANTDDVKREAHKAYKDSQTETEIEKRKSFLYEHCWIECTKNAKWCMQELTMTSSKRRKPNDGSTSTSPNSSTGANPNSSTGANDSLIDKYNEPIDVDATDGGAIFGDEVVRPPGRKISKDNKKMQGQDKAVVEVLSNLQKNVQELVNHLKEELKFKKENAKNEYELRKFAINEELALKKKIQRRRDQQRVMNQDLSKLTPSEYELIRQYRSSILKEWQEEDFHY